MVTMEEDAERPSFIADFIASKTREWDIVHAIKEGRVMADRSSAFSWI